MKVKLIRLDGGKSLRSTIVDGECEYLPVEGKSFVMWGEPLTDVGNIRIVQTSTVIEVDKLDSDDEEYIFITETGSKYHVEVM